MNESVVVFESAGSLVGIVTDPPGERAQQRPPCVVFLNAGIVHRVGPNRLYVKLARRLARLGFVVLRFDFSGIGDSEIRRDHCPVEQSAVSEARVAMDYVAKTRPVDTFILVGLCSGAIHAAAAAFADQRVAAAVLINPRGGTTHLRATMQGRSVARKFLRLFRQRPLDSLRAVKDKASLKDVSRIWRALKLLAGVRGRSNSAALAEAISIAQRWQQLAERGVRLLLVYSEWDPARDQLEIIPHEEFKALMASREITLKVVDQTDHTFTQSNKQQALFDLIETWIEQGRPPKDTQMLH